MKTTIILAIFSLLIGCGSGHDNYGYGYYYDEIGASGMRVRYNGYPTPTLAQIEALYNETMECVGVASNGPLVIFVHDTFANGVYGRTILSTGTILISSLLDPDLSLSFWMYKHEFVHYLLHQSGFDPARNAAHDSPLFGTCADL